MANSIALRQRILGELVDESNEDLLNDIESLIISYRIDGPNPFPWEETKEFNNALEEAEQEIETGNVHSHEDVMAYVKRKYLNGNNLVE